MMRAPTNFARWRVHRPQAPLRFEIRKMSSDTWYSAKLRFVVMVEPVGGDTLNDCIYLFRAVDFPAAFQRAVTIGESSQKEYRNADGQRVLWRFKEVISLDIIRTNGLD